VTRGVFVCEQLDQRPRKSQAATSHTTHTMYAADAMSAGDQRYHLLSESQTGSGSLTCHPRQGSKTLTHGENPILANF
jgi:hypothetical protein